MPFTLYEWRFLKLILRQQITLPGMRGQKIRSSRHNAIKHDGQLFMILRSDELTV